MRHTGHAAMMMAASMMAAALSGCGPQGHDLAFRKKMVIDYRSKSSPLECIEYVGRHKVTNKDISRDGRRLSVGNLIVRWKGNFTTENTGVYAVTFTSNMSEDVDITKSVTVADISAPSIVIPNRNVNLSLDELKDLDPNDLFYAKDNSDDDISVRTDYEANPSETGDYPLKITAIDAAGNTGREELILHVTVPEEPKPEENQPQKEAKDKSEKKNQENADRGGSSDKPKKEEKKQSRKKRQEKKKAPSPSRKAPQPHVMKPKRKATAQPRTFAFRQGSSMGATYQEAVAYAKSMLSQGRASGYDIAPIQGADGIYTGYRVTFS